MSAGVFEKPPVERRINLPQLRDRYFETALLLFEQIDLRHALLPGEMQIGAIPLVEEMPDLGQREAESPAGDDEREAFAISAVVKAYGTVTLRRDEPLRLIEAKRPHRDAEVARNVPDRHGAVVDQTAGWNAIKPGAGGIVDIQGVRDGDGSIPQHG